MSENLEVREISVEDTYPLRQTVLRPGRPPELSMYPGDNDENTHHFGAILNGEIVGVATIFPEPLPDYNFNYSWRLRGMAVSPEQQGKGIGKQLLQHCIEFVRAKGGDALWCNGRTNVFGFYGSFGFEKIGEEFYIPESGAHFVMMLRLIK